MVEVVAGVTQMVVEVEVVAEEATKTGAINTTISLEIIIQGTTIITTEEGAAEVVAITTTMVQAVKLIMSQVMWGCNHDKL